MANPEPAGEPSMEDILASIRRIISDDEEGGEDGQEADVPETEAKADENQVDFDAVDAEEPAKDEPNDQSSIDDIFELTEVADDEPEPEPEAEMGQDAVDEIDFDSIGDDAVDEAEDAADLDFVDVEIQASEPEPEPEVEIAPPPAAPETQPDMDGLLSSGAQATASAAFGALASTMLSHSGGARTLEEIVEDLLRPLLKVWLDQNLPPLVEKLVREEIERVARRGA